MDIFNIIRIRKNTWILHNYVQLNNHHHHHQVKLIAWILLTLFLSLSLDIRPYRLLDDIKCPHRAEEYVFEPTGELMISPLLHQQFLSFLTDLV